MHWPWRRPKLQQQRHPMEMEADLPLLAATTSPDLLAPATSFPTCCWPRLHPTTDADVLPNLQLPGVVCAEQFLDQWYSGAVHGVLLRWFPVLSRTGGSSPGSGVLDLFLDRWLLPIPPLGCGRHSPCIWAWSGLSWT